MLNTPRLYQEIGEKIKILITSNYPNGSRLMPEREIAEYFNISRTIVREALIMLELEGLISIKKGSGVYILKQPNVDQDHSHLEINDYGPFEVLQARQVIESSISACAALQVTKMDILEMRKVLNDEKIAVVNLDAGTSEENDHKFHYLIAKASQNGIMLEILEKLWHARVNNKMWTQLHLHIQDKNYRQQWLLDHEQILNALQKKDPVAARYAMWQHLGNVKNSLMTLSDVNSPDFDGFLFESLPYDTLYN